MSGCSSSSSCPVCGGDMDVYTDWKPFDSVNMNCLNCGFYGYVQTGMHSDDERQADWIDQGRDVLDFAPNSSEYKREMIDAYESACGTLGPREKENYLGITKTAVNSKRDMVKDIIVSMLMSVGVSESASYEKAADSADQIFDVLGFSDIEQDKLV